MAASACGLDWTQNLSYEKITDLPPSSLPTIKSGNIPCISILNSARSNFIENEVDSIEFIQLETSKKSLIAFSQEFMVANNCYLVHDHPTSTLLVFDAKGKFLRQIGSRGQGPKEFDHIGCFTLSNNKFYIVDTYTHDLLCFEWDGKFVSKNHIECDDYIQQIAPLGDDLMLSLVSAPPKRIPAHRLVVISTDGKLKKKILPTEYTYPAAAENIRMAKNGKVLINPSHSDTIFSISNDCIKPILKLGYYKNGEEDQIRDYYCTLTPNVFYKYINSDEDKSLMSFTVHEMNGCFVLEYDQSPKISYLSIVDKQDKSCKTYLRYNRNKDIVELPFPLYASDNETHLISFCSNQEWIKEHDSLYTRLSLEQKELLAKHTPEDNPFIIRMKLKKR